MYSYQQCIELSKKDLQTYSQKELQLLCKVLGLSINVDQSKLVEEIATKLIDGYWKPQRGNMLKEDLPYAGNIIAAMRAQDRDAIRQIQEYNASQQVERNQLVAEESSRESPTDCENSIDYITQEEWSEENQPNVKIELWDIDNGTKRIICFELEALQKWINDTSHQMAPWIPNQQGGVMDDDGHGGGPSKTIFTQLPEHTLVFGNPQVYEGDWIGIPTAKNVRIGNRTGSLGMSETHGQVPGRTVYTVYPSNLEDYQDIFRDSFVGDLNSRMMDGGVILLRNILEGDTKTRFVRIFDDSIAESIIDPDTLYWDRFADISADESLVALSALPEFEQDLYKFNTTINYENDELTGAQELQEIFFKVAAHINENELILDAYNTIVKEFYPVWLNNHIVNVFLPTLTFEQVIKASQRLWSTYPANDMDYDLNDQRIGTGLAYDTDFDEITDLYTDSDEESDSFYN